MAEIFALIIAQVGMGLGKKNRQSYLPDEKQFLYTTNIFSNRIIQKQEYKEHIIYENDDDDGRTVTEHKNIYKENKQNDKRISSSGLESDMNIFVEEDDNVLAEVSDPNTRKYDLYITYDKYYQTPRFWILDIIMIIYHGISGTWKIYPQNMLIKRSLMNTILIYLY